MAALRPSSAHQVTSQSMLGKGFSWSNTSVGPFVTSTYQEYNYQPLIVVDAVNDSEIANPDPVGSFFTDYLAEAGRGSPASAIIGGSNLRRISGDNRFRLRPAAGEISTLYLIYDLCSVFATQQSNLHRKGIKNNGLAMIATQAHCLKNSPASTPPFSFHS